MPETDSLKYVREHIALGTGWTFVLAHDSKYWTDPSGRYVGGGTHDPLPKYIDSLEDIQEAVKSLSPTQFREWKSALCNVCAALGHDPIIASAHSRTLALYKILP
jgi:hypothetical protein